MLKVRENLKIFLSQESVDMRKSVNGLSILVLEALKLQPQDGSLYIFWNRCMNKLKILFYDRNGFVLYYKILDKGKFCILKKIGSSSLELTIEQLDWLIAGLNIEIIQKFPEIKYRYFY